MIPSTLAFITGLMASLNETPLAGLMLVVALGYSLGRVALRGISLGPAGGTLAVALVFGLMGLDYSAFYGSLDPKLTLGTLGFALFIYSVGFEAGPRFFSTLFGRAGWQIAGVTIAVSVLAVTVAILCGWILGLGDSVTAGMLSGALTSAPTYAAAFEVCSDRTALSLSFALTYPIGLLGLVFLVVLVPRMMKDDLTDSGEEAGHVGADERRDPEMQRAFVVETDNAIGRTLAELQLPRRTGCYVTRILRADEVHLPAATMALQAGDHLMVKGRVDELREFEKLVGPEIDDEAFRQRLPAPRRIRVLGRSTIGKPLAELDMFVRHRCLVTAVDRAGIVHEPSAEFVLQRADILEVVGPRADLRRLAEELGRFEGQVGETDIAVYAGGIFLGAMIGGLHVTSFGFDFRLGYANGLLLFGILLGRFRKIGPFHTNVPRPARQLVRDLGILLFVAETGVRAGGGPWTAIAPFAVPAILAAIITTLVPVLGAIYLARRVLHMRPAQAWGTVGGAMTSSAALVAVRRAADSNEPALSYAAAYALASVLVTIAGQVVVAILS